MSFAELPEAVLYFLFARHHNHFVSKKTGSNVFLHLLKGCMFTESVHILGIILSLPNKIRQLPPT